MSRLYKLLSVVAVSCYLGTVFGAMRIRALGSWIAARRRQSSEGIFR